MNHSVFLLAFLATLVFALNRTVPYNYCKQDGVQCLNLYNHTRGAIIDCTNGTYSVYRVCHDDKICFTKPTLHCALPVKALDRASRTAAIDGAGVAATFITAQNEIAPSSVIKEDINNDVSTLPQAHLSYEL